MFLVECLQIIVVIAFLRSTAERIKLIAGRIEVTVGIIHHIDLIAPKDNLLLDIIVVIAGLLSFTNIVATRPFVSFTFAHIIVVITTKYFTTAIIAYMITASFFFFLRISKFI